MYPDQQDPGAVESFKHAHSGRKMLEHDAEMFALGLVARRVPWLHKLIVTVIVLGALLLAGIAIVSFIMFGRI
jgi:hypothetical protein